MLISKSWHLTYQHCHFPEEFSLFFPEYIVVFLCVCNFVCSLCVVCVLLWCVVCFIEFLLLPRANKDIMMMMMMMMMIAGVHLICRWQHLRWCVSSLQWSGLRTTVTPRPRRSTRLELLSRLLRLVSDRSTLVAVCCNSFATHWLLCTWYFQHSWGCGLSESDWTDWLGSAWIAQC